MRFFLLALFLIGSLPAVSPAQAPSQTPIDIQPVKELVPTGTLGTCGYAPIDRESEHYKKLDQSELATGSFMAPYDIHAKKGKYVSWYGIVRGITASGEHQTRITLLLEHKYFDGMTDCHIMLVSHSGGGDFLATLDSFPTAIPALALVRIYGKVVDQTAGTPRIEAEYVRVWSWGTFTFPDLGAADKSNPVWTKYSKLKEGQRIYNPYPHESYYRFMLGNPDDFGLNWKPQP